ncbi:S24 family peptidase [Pararoseomonas sp. SCSIO 73927]|uniref:helix-turn-helix domain-containing protein n=1 Tax=Pararoseomonas sp. SCSIO 73927 TaxID=3114537 RepID=UPI0030D1C6ED
MENELEMLIRRIRERMDVMGWSERETMRQAGVNEHALRNIQKGHSPRPQTLAKLASALKVPPSYFLLAAAPQDGRPGVLQMETVFVKGAVQAGVWTDALEWDPGDWIEIQAPTDPRLPKGAERFGLLVRGRSMDRVYPPGSMLICVRYYDLLRGPKTGDDVIVMRRSVQLGGFEATVKEYQMDEEGRHVLWPRSTDPAFQAPIVIPQGAAPVASPNGSFATQDWDHAAFHQAGEPDVLITSRVISVLMDRATDL